MSQLHENPISDEDIHIAEICQLGRPLEVYKASAHAIRSAYKGALVMSIVSITGFVLLLILGSTMTWPAFFLPDLVGVAILFVGVALGLTAGPDARRKHLVVCEKGFVIVSKLFKSNRSVRIVYYRDIYKIRRTRFLGDQYYIWSGLGSIYPMTDSYYQNADELVALIKEQLTESQKLRVQMN